MAKLDAPDSGIVAGVPSISGLDSIVTPQRSKAVAAAASFGLNSAIGSSAWATLNRRIAPRPEPSGLLLQLVLHALKRLAHLDEHRLRCEAELTQLSA